MKYYFKIRPAILKEKSFKAKVDDTKAGHNSSGELKSVFVKNKIFFVHNQKSYKCNAPLYSANKKK